MLCMVLCDCKRLKSGCRTNRNNQNMLGKLISVLEYYSDIYNGQSPVQTEDSGDNKISSAHKIFKCSMCFPLYTKAALFNSYPLKTIK